MSTKEVCEYLGISHDTLRRRVDAGLIKPEPRNPILLKAALRFSRSDVEALKQSRPAPPAQAAPQGTGEKDG